MTVANDSELVVHHLPGAWGLPSISPFCLKLDTYLRIAGIPCKAVVDATPFGAIADVLGDKPFLLGAAPTEIDAVAYGLLPNVMHVPLASPVKDAALARPNLVAYVDRMRARFFE